MRIDRIDLREIRLSLRERFEISSGAKQDRRILLLTLHGEGVEGWGECVVGEDPGYSYETTETAWHIYTDFLLPRVVGREFNEPAGLADGVPWIRGHRMARGALEMAGWDLAAKLEGVSLANCLGGERQAVPVGVSIGIQPTDAELLEKAEGYLDDGYARIKIKIKPGRDVAMLRLVRERFPEVQMMADANSAYSLADIDLLKQLDELSLMMIEQPLAHDDLLDHSRLQDAIETPVCLDESIRSVGDAELAIRLGACRIINIKPGRVGGLASARAIHDLCVANSVPVWHGGMLESGIGRAHNLALASLPGFTLPGDISASSRYWLEDVVEPEFVVSEGRMVVPTGAGIGVTPRLDRMQELTVRKVSFTA